MGKDNKGGAKGGGAKGGDKGGGKKGGKEDGGDKKEAKGGTSVNVRHILCEKQSK